MTTTTIQSPYPVYSFPPIASAAIQEVVAETKAPIAMVGSSFLAAMALAVQAQYRVRRFEGLESPCSLAVVSICASGERKTTVDRKATRAFYDFEEEQKYIHDTKYSLYRGEKWPGMQSSGCFVANSKNLLKIMNLSTICNAK